MAFSVLMFDMEFNFQELMKQVQKLQEHAKQLQEELGRKTVTASSGGGMVTVTMSGKQELLSIKLDPICVDSRDIPMLEDLILAAVNQGMKKSRELMAEEMKALTGGLPLPFDLF
jgi:nucleoid-associated protein EbfC